MKLKTVLYNATIILPVISKIIKSIRFIVEFNRNNQEVLAARTDILEQIKYLQEVVQEISDFHRLNSTDEE